MLDIFRAKGSFLSYKEETLVMLAEFQKGNLKCFYCDETAKYMINGKPCCQPKLKLCPEQHNYVSKILKEKYIKDPTLRERMSESLKIAQNKPEVVEKKRETMILLHRGDCDECKEFQKRYLSGQKKTRGVPKNISDEERQIRAERMREVQKARWKKYYEEKGLTESILERHED
jgi:hypothetical protein